jgi:hypothetical protein
VIGGSGLIGSKVVARLAEQGHEAIAASPQSGVNTLTGQGSPRSWPAPGNLLSGAPHGLTATLQDRVNADLLAFLQS